MWAVAAFTTCPSTHPCYPTGRYDLVGSSTIFPQQSEDTTVQRPSPVITCTLLALLHVLSKNPALWGYSGVLVQDWRITTWPFRGNTPNIGEVKRFPLPKITSFFIHYGYLFIFLFPL